MVKNPPANAGDIRDVGLIPASGRWHALTLKRAWQPMPGSLPGESHGQKSLVGSIVHRVAESDLTEVA